MPAADKVAVPGRKSCQDEGDTGGRGVRGKRRGGGEGAGLERAWATLSTACVWLWHGLVSSLANARVGHMLDLSRAYLFHTVLSGNLGTVLH